MLVGNDPETLDPRYATDAVGLRTTRLLHAGLVRLNADTLEPEPSLARSWRWRDPLSLQIDLRDDVSFHSGAPFGSRDVAETLRAMASDRVASRHARVVDAIAEVHEEGPHTVLVRLARPHATLLADLELPILRADEAWSPPAPDGSLDGLGPYVVAGSDRGEVRLAPAAHGALPLPSHAVTLRTVHDENTLALRLATGRSDVALNLVSPTLIPALAAEPGLAVTARAGANLAYVVVQETRGTLGDVRTRQGISLAIDRSMLCETLFDRRATPAGGLIAPTHWASVRSQPLAFDPVKARALLDASGTARAHLTLLTSTERLRGDVARVVAQELADVGVEATVVALELGTMIARLNRGDFDLALLVLPEMTEPNVLRHFLHGAFVPPAGANRGRVQDDVLDALLDAGDRVADPAARRVIYSQVEAREREQMHVVPLWYADQVALTSKRARAFVPSAEGRWLGLATLK
jgi:peptide/nickel transport system substrate-binding protein